ncbi:MAG: hypothetical protein R3E12_13210 [Candidatus Eisenbacteria bacterium]
MRSASLRLRAARPRRSYEERHAAALQEVGLEVGYLLDRERQVERRVREVEVSGFDLREVEQVVDEREHRLAGALDELGVLLLLLRQRGVEQQMREADHSVHGSADLVAHGREKLALGPACRFGRLLGLPELIVGRTREDRVGTRRRSGNGRSGIRRS